MAAEKYKDVVSEQKIKPSHFWCFFAPTFLKHLSKFPSRSFYVLSGKVAGGRQRALGPAQLKRLERCNRKRFAIRSLSSSLTFAWPIFLGVPPRTFFFLRKGERGRTQNTTTNKQEALQAGPDQKRHPKQRTFLVWSAENAKINLGVKKQLSLCASRTAFLLAVETKLLICF